MTLFLYNFPPQPCSRLWDYLITNNIFSIIKLIVPLLDVFKQKLLLTSDIVDFMDIFNAMTSNTSDLTDPASPYYLNLTEIVKKANLVKLDKKMISKYAKLYLEDCEPDNQYA